MRYGRSWLGATAIRLAVALGVWMGLAAVLARRRVIAFERGLGAQGLGRTFAEHAAVFSVWAVLTLPVIALARRFPLRRGALGRALVVHLAAGIGFAVVSLTLQRLLFSSWLWPAAQSTPLADRLARLPRADRVVEVLTYWTIIGVWHAVDLYTRSRDRALRAAELELQATQLREGLARAQLDALRAQLDPHFLFNTLNTISVLMSEDVAEANRMLLRLGELLRASLATSAVQVVELRQELAFVRGYLEIEQARLQDRLSVRIDIEPAALDARVPSMILQPLVENAIRHGISPRLEPGTVEIRATRRNGRLELQVRDDGPGLSGTAQPGTGIGLSTTRARLEQLYGAAHRLELESAVGGGLLVTVAIPA